MFHLIYFWFMATNINNINRFVLQECGRIVESVWLWRISGGYSQEMIVVFGTQIFY